MLQVTEKQGILVVDSRLIAEELGIEHRSLLATLDSHLAQIEEAFGAVRFEIAPRKDGNIGGSQPKYALLTEDQAIFLMTLSRNTDQVVKAKFNLVKAFSQARAKLKELNPDLTALLIAINSLSTEVQTLKDRTLRLDLVEEEKAQLSTQLTSINNAGLQHQGCYNIVQAEINAQDKTLITSYDYLIDIDKPTEYAKLLSRLSPINDTITNNKGVILLFGCQQVLIQANEDTQAVIEYICSESNKVFNCAIYYARQIYFKAHRYATKAELDEEIKTNKHFQAMYSQAAQQTCHSVFESFKSFKALNKLFQQGKLAQKPKPPKYRKGGLNLVAYPKQAIKLIDGNIRIPLGSKVKVWFGIDSFTIPMPSNLDFNSIRELRILPRNQCFYAEFVYKLEAKEVDLNPDNALGIDPGMDNWLTCVSTVGTSFIIDGKHVKSLNRWYNKKVSTIKEGKPQGFWSKKLAHLTEKRNRQMRDAVNKAARLVINHCLSHKIGTLVFGWNQGQKQESNMGSKNNQKWVQVPTARLKDRIYQLCKQYGIKFIETEESYTSKASFADGDYLPKYGEKPLRDWKPSGRRVKRGLYRTALNWYINADCNGSANILRKVSRMLGLNLSGLFRVQLTAPQRIFLWSAKRKKCSDAVLTRHETSA